MLCELLSLLCMIMLPACKGSGTREKAPERTVAAMPGAGDENPRFVKSIQFVAPTRNDTCHFNQVIRVAYANNRRFPVDSAHVLYNNVRVTTLDSAAREFSFKIPRGKCGANLVKIVAFHPGNRQGSIVQPVVVKPDTPPRRLAFEIARVYPHDVSASTQGLVYHDGFLYEGTGIHGESTLRKIDLERNKQLDMFSLSSEYFGEGITIYKEKIYQITWTSRKGFVYDLKTFKQESTFDYTTQGWGITTMHDTLVMSDGSHLLHHLSPASFSKLKTVEVYDHHGPVHSLNELEWIDGRVWANVWLTDRVVVIDPASGVVVEELYLPNMLSPAEKIKLNIKEDVLNGIAYNPERGTIYVTGKHWPKLFELKIKR
jgi:glutamine cyclotransferase